MPFKPIPDEPSTTPDVTIAFSGLILLQPGPKDTCLIGVNKFDRAHIFQVLLIVTRPNRRPISIPLFVGPLFAPFSIGLDPHPDPDPDQGDFAAFAQDPFNRLMPPSQELDYRWAINFKDFHFGVQTNDGAEPAGVLKTGVLYTPHLTDPSLNPRLTREGSPDFPLNQIASSLAVSIDLPEETHLVFRWQDMGQDQHLTLPRDPDPEGTVYTLHFLNEPPSLNVTPHDEFELYYKVLKTGGGPVPIEQRFELDVDRAVRSDEIPCMPGTLNP